MAGTLTLADVAKQLHVSTRTVRRYIERNELRCIYLGLSDDDPRRQIRFTQEQVDAFVKSRST